MLHVKPFEACFEVPMRKIFLLFYVACYVYFSKLPKGSSVNEKKIGLSSAKGLNLTTKSGSILCVVKMIVLQGRDVENCSDDSHAMADKPKNKRRGNCCVASGPNMANCESDSLTPGVTMHYFPKDKTLRKKWTQFAGVHRKDFVPSKSATLCSLHFDKKCFESKPVLFTSAESGKAIHLKRYLIKGSIPTRHTVVPHGPPLTSWKRQVVSKNFLAFVLIVLILLCFDFVHWFPFI